jgi:hypothetical protein
MIDYKDISNTEEEVGLGPQYSILNSPNDSENA